MMFCSLHVPFMEHVFGFLQLRFLSFSTVCLDLTVNLGFVVAGYHCFDIVHVAVAYFNGVPIEYFVQWI